MFFEYPHLLWLLLVPVLLIAHYIYLELAGRRPHLRVPDVKFWKAGGRSAMSVLRHVPFILRTAALVMIIIAIARPRSSTKMDKLLLLLYYQELLLQMPYLPQHRHL